VTAKRKKQMNDLESVEVVEGDSPADASCKIIEQIKRAFGPIPCKEHANLFAYLHDFLVIHQEDQICIETNKLFGSEKEGII
jgi:hypothetical protein